MTLTRSHAGMIYKVSCCHYLTFVTFEMIEIPARFKKGAVWPSKDDFVKGIEQWLEATYQVF